MFCLPRVFLNSLVDFKVFPFLNESVVCGSLSVTFFQKQRFRRFENEGRQEEKVDMVEIGV
jgi:hypothetical protein